MELETKNVSQVEQTPNFIFRHFTLSVCWSVHTYSKQHISLTTHTRSFMFAFTRSCFFFSTFLAPRGTICYSRTELKRIYSQKLQNVVTKIFQDQDMLEKFHLKTQMRTPAGQESILPISVKLQLREAESSIF